MATRKSTTKALKAKVTQRTAPKRKAAPKAKKEPCPVVKLMEEQVERIMWYGALWRAYQAAAANSDKEKKLLGYCRALRDRILGATETVSHMRPRSNSGAMYLAQIAYADLEHAHKITDSELRDRRQRRGLRCLSTALNYLDYSPGHGTNNTIELWFMPHNETQRTIAVWSEIEGQKLLEAERAEIAAAQRAAS